MSPKYRKDRLCPKCERPLVFRAWITRDGKRDYARYHGFRAWCFCPHCGQN